MRKLKTMDEIYLEMLRYVMNNGIDRTDRTGVGTKSVFGYQYRIDLNDGFPILTTKTVHYKSVFEELAWFLNGSTNSKELEARGCNIWREWADERGELGPIYGYQWTRWTSFMETLDEHGCNPQYEQTTVNQIEELVKSLTERPFSRRHILSAWNVVDLPDETKSPQENVKNGKMALAPCHVLYQFYVRDSLDGERYVDCMMTQRSADIFLGLPFNICSVATLLYILSAMTGYVPGQVVHSIGDLHLYKNHVEQATLQLSRRPRKHPEFRLVVGEDSNGKVTMDWEFTTAYDPHPAIKAPVAV